MPDKECTISLLELAFAVGQLRANPTKNKEHVGAMGEILSGWECRKSGDDGKAFDGLAGAVDTAYKAKTEFATARQVDKIFSEYHSLLLAMGYLDLEQMGQPIRSPVATVGFKDGELFLEDFRLESIGTGAKAFTDYRQVKVAKPTTAETPETPPEPAAPRARSATQIAQDLFRADCFARNPLPEGEGRQEANRARMGTCAQEWSALRTQSRNKWIRQAQAQIDAAAAGEGETTGRWGYGREKKRRGASRWTPQNARNSILR